ncbi:MAG: hypothetical protein MK086_03580 [Flavobacteriales bacterium]|nr:hypothetical protein [Flavobacteriales bacterium]
MNDLLKPISLIRNLEDNTLIIETDLRSVHAVYDISDADGKLLSSGVLTESQKVLDLSSFEGQPAIFLLQVGSRLSIQRI